MPGPAPACAAARSSTVSMIVPLSSSLSLMVTPIDHSRSMVRWRFCRVSRKGFFSGEYVSGQPALGGAGRGRRGVASPQCKAPREAGELSAVAVGCDQAGAPRRRLAQERGEPFIHQEERTFHGVLITGAQKPRRSAVLAVPAV